MASSPSSFRKAPSTERDNLPKALLDRIGNAIRTDVGCQQLLTAYPCLQWNMQVWVHIARGQVVGLEYAKFNPDVKEVGRVGHT